MVDKDSAASPPRTPGPIAADRSPFAVAVIPVPSPAEMIVEQWFTETIHNSVVSRHTEIFNYVRSSVDELKRRLVIAAPPSL